MAASSSGSAYRFERPPIVVYTEADVASGSETTFHVFVRTVRPLPRTRRGIRALILIDKARPMGTPFTESARPPCYSTEIGADENAPAAPELAHPRDGQLVTVSFRVRGKTVARTTVRAHAVGAKGVGDDQADRRFLKRLRCGPRAR